ncbi:BA14K family protein [Chelativorans sp. ZYF759]|uniref:BA14K family protein n=1 Tax=Chelativorans sp. ZYF759 TaxID=2692213 RepID=UPI00145FAFDF|nr:BA14K family protein [Chelativorans sp. ZYF759]NMG40579.1 BA14K family protein [Chelativorans sp. ZYF759]
MKRLTSYLCAAAMAVSTIGLGTAGANAQPIPTPTQFQGQFGNSNVIEVQRRDARQRPPSARGGFELRGGSAYYRGHRGQRQARQGWRQHQGWWFPPAAFVAGAIIGGAVAQQPRPAPRAPQRGLSRSHVEWCYGQYRSYRASDNTFQPYQGPRRACRSPFG